MSQIRKFFFPAVACVAALLCQFPKAAAAPGLSHSSTLAYRLIERNAKIIVLAPSGRDVIQSFEDAPLGKCWKDPNNDGFRKFVQQIAEGWSRNAFDLSLSEFQVLLSGSPIFALWEPFPPTPLPRFLLAVVPSSQPQETYSVAIEKLKAKLARDTDRNWITQDGRSILRIDGYLTIVEENGVMMATTLEEDPGELLNLIRQAEDVPSDIDLSNHLAVETQALLRDGSQIVALARVKDIIASVFENSHVSTSRSLLRPTGVDSISWISLSVAFAEEGILLGKSLRFEPGSTGLLQRLLTRPRAEIPRLIEARPVFYYSLPLPPGRILWSEIVACFKSVGEEDDFFEAVQRVNDELGISIRDELVYKLDGQIVLAADWTMTPVHLQNFKMLVRATDSASLLGAVRKVLEKFNTPTLTRSSHGRTYLVVNTPIVQICCAAIDDVLAVTLGGASMRGMLRLASQRPAPSDRPFIFQKEDEELIAYVDTASVLGNLEIFAEPILWNFLRKNMFGLAGAHLLPDISTLTENAKPLTVTMKADGNILRIRTVSSYLADALFMTGPSTAAILAAVAVPNFLNAQVRAKVSRTHAEQRMLATALEEFFIDNTRYPVPLEGNYIDCAGVRIGEGERARTIRLTTPVSYLSQIPKDLFDPSGRAHRYFSDGKSFYIIGSHGPDGKEDYDVSTFTGDQESVRKFLYDPSNGVKSSGDILKMGP